MLVCIERKTAVAFPLRARLFWTYRTVLIAAVCIIGFSLLISLPAHVTYEVQFGAFNVTIFNATTGEQTIVEQPTITKRLRVGLEAYWRVATTLDAFFIVILPVALVIATNISIIGSLRRHKAPLAFEDGGGGTSRCCTTTTSNASEASSLRQNCATTNANNRNQRRATLIVLIITSTFAFCQTPSALIHLFEVFTPQVNKRRRAFSRTLSDLVIFVAGHRLCTISNRRRPRQQPRRHIENGQFLPILHELGAFSLQRPSNCAQQTRHAYKQDVARRANAHRERLHERNRRGVNTQRLGKSAKCGEQTQTCATELLPQLAKSPQSAATAYDGAATDRRYCRRGRATFARLVNSRRLAVAVATVCIVSS